MIRLARNLEAAEEALQEAFLTANAHWAIGLETEEVAWACPVPEATMAQRLVRLKRKSSAAGILYRIPSKAELPERLDLALAVFYLIFKEGYSASGGDRLVRAEVCEEAIRLARLVNELLPGNAEVGGLLALMCLTHSRRDARVDHKGGLVALDEQDRSSCHRGEIQEGVEFVQTALRRKCLAKYQLQAAMAAPHGEEADASEADWGQIAQVYGELLRFEDDLIVRLNYAAAIAYACGWQQGFYLLLSIEGLKEFHPYFAAKARMLRKLGRLPEARAAFERAIGLTQNAASGRISVERWPKKYERSPVSDSPS